MKVVYLIAGTYRAAGMERVLAVKANWLAAHGYEVLIATTDQRGRVPAFRLDSSIRTADLGINYEENNGASFLNKAFRYPFKQIRHRIRLTRLLKKEHADITVSMFCNDASFLPLIDDGSRKILEIHFSRYKRIQYGRKGLWALADRIRSRRDLKTVSRFEKFIVLTEEDKAYWGDTGNIGVIPNARTFTPEEFKSVSRSKTVLAAGRYNYQKAFDRLVRAWKRLADSGMADGWTLRIAGDGEERGALESLVSGLGLDGSVVLGNAEGDIRELYSDASVFALSSRYEGLPMVLLEAQAAGLPIVAMDCKCGPRDIITDGIDGFIVPEGDDISLFSEKLASLMDDAVLREKMGAAALASSERFELERVMKQWQALFEGGRRTIVVSAVNIRKGGTLTILRQCLEHLSQKADEYRIVALVHKAELCRYEGIEYIEMPWCSKTWGLRLIAEYFSMHRTSKRIAAEDGRKIWLWLSMHDTTPRVDAQHREVYCHTSFPFMKIRFRDWFMDPHIPVFALLTGLVYRINIKRNDSVIVQQNWFADGLSRITGYPRNRIRVIPPVSEIPDFEKQADGEKIPVFLYVSTPDCHKNFECLCEASKILSEEGLRFKTVLTTDGKENRYSRWLLRKWGGVPQIDFHGLMPKDELFGAYASATCLVFPSRIETWGLPVSEFLAVNKGGKMLLADLPYAHETSGGKGLYFNPGKPQELASLMRKTIEEYEDIAVG